MDLSEAGFRDRYENALLSTQKKGKSRAKNVYDYKGRSEINKMVRMSEIIQSKPQKDNMVVHHSSSSNRFELDPPSAQPNMMKLNNKRSVVAAGAHSNNTNDYYILS